MHGLVLIVCALELGAPSPSAEQAAQAVAEGADVQQNVQALMRKGRFGLRALVRQGRIARGEGRRRVYEALGAFRGEEAVSALLEGLRASDKQAQIGAVNGLARIGTKATVEPLVQMAVTTDPEVREAVVEGLTRVGRLAEPKVRALARDPSPFARETAVRFLGRFHTGQKRRAAILDGLRDREANVRGAAVELAELWRDMSLAEALVELSRDQDAEVAARAVEAVAKFPSLRKELPAILSDPRVTQQAWMTAFHRMRDYDDMAIPYLIAAVSKADERRQPVMLDLLSADATKAELRRFVELLDSPDEDVAEVVVGLLNQMGARADTAAARMILDERDSLVEAVREYLSMRPRHGITDEILDATKEGPVEERAEHITIIGKIAPEEVREDLAELLDDTETQVRVAAARALAGLNDVGAEAELVRLLDDPKKEVRIEALRALATYDSRLATLARMTAIEDPDPDVRTAAMRSFAGSDADHVLEALERVVRSGSHEERLTALTAIAEVKTTRAAVLLVDLVTESDSDVQKAAFAFFDTLPELAPEHPDEPEPVSAQP